jgi:hypothetical protein
MGICFNYTAELDKALSCFSRSLEIRPDYHDALQWKVRLSTRIADEAASRNAQTHGEASDATRRASEPAVGDAVPTTKLAGAGITA